MGGEFVMVQDLPDSETFYTSTRELHVVSGTGRELDSFKFAEMGKIPSANKFI